MSTRIKTLDNIFNKPINSVILINTLKIINITISRITSPKSSKKNNLISHNSNKKNKEWWRVVESKGTKYWLALEEREEYFSPSKNKLTKSNKFNQIIAIMVMILNRSKILPVSIKFRRDSSSNNNNSSIKNKNNMKWWIVNQRFASNNKIIIAISPANDLRLIPNSNIPTAMCMFQVKK